MEFLVLEFNNTNNFKTLKVLNDLTPKDFFIKKTKTGYQEFYKLNAHVDFTNYIINFFNSIPEYLTFVKFDTVVQYAKIKYKIEKGTLPNEPTIDSLIKNKKLTSANYHEILRYYKIKKYQINPDDSVDVFQDVLLEHIKGYKNNFPIKFNIIHGSFTLSNTEFECIESWAPKKVTQNLECSLNSKLKTLKGFPAHIGRNFICIFNSLRNLDYCPKYVGGYINALGNKNLECVKGLSKHANRYFLDDAFKSVEESFIDSKFPKLKLLKNVEIN